MTEEIGFRCEGQLGVVTLNRPQALNALNLPMIKRLQTQLEHWDKDDKIHAVVIQAEGGKAFCAGGDVRWLYEAGRAKNPEQMAFFWHEYRLNHYIHQYRKPYIALMDGITMGGGVGISLHGSYPVASERFIFAMPETGIGFFPDIGASYLLAACPGALGVYLGLTGNRLTAQDALFAGLIKQVVPSEQFPLVLAQLIETDLSKNPQQAVDACLKQFAMTARQAPIEKDCAAIDYCFAQPSVENIFSALQEEGGEWASGILALLQQKAPLSLKVTLAQIQKAKTMSMAECIKMDYCLVERFMQDSDFYEGVRALLIDKDRTPHWKPASLALVSPAMVADYFEAPEPELALI